MNGKHRGASMARLKWWQTAFAVVPTAMMAGAWGFAFSASSSGADAAEYRYVAPTPTVPTERFDLPTVTAVPASPATNLPLAGGVNVSTLRSAALPGTALAAYRRAASIMATTDPTCKISWELIAAIGRVESDNGLYGGSTLTADGQTTRPILGIALTGANNTARIADTDHGAWDGDPVWDRAVGPMQFIPSTWRAVAVDANNDGKKDPNNIQDAALGAAVYLCVGNNDLSTPAGARSAVMSYNHSVSYVDNVLAIAAAYSRGEFNPTQVVPVGSTVSPTRLQHDARPATVEAATTATKHGTHKAKHSTSTKGHEQVVALAEPISKTASAKPSASTALTTSPAPATSPTQSPAPTTPTTPAVDPAALAAKACTAALSSTWLTATEVTSSTKDCTSAYVSAYKAAKTPAAAATAGAAAVSSLTDKAKATSLAALLDSDLAVVKDRVDESTYAGFITKVTTAYATSRKAAQAEIATLVAANPEPASPPSPDPATDSPTAAPSAGAGG